MDLNRLTIGDRVLVIAGIVFFLTMFLPWYGEGDFHRSGWHYFFTGVIPLLLIVAVTAFVLVTRFVDDLQLPDLPLPVAQLLLIPAGIAAVLVLLRLILGDDAGAFGFSVDLSRKFGIFFALLAAAGVVVGAVLKMQEGDEAPTHGSTPPQPF